MVSHDDHPTASGSHVDIALEAQRVLADSLPVLIMMSGPDGVVNYFNRRWFEFTGQPYFERDVSWDWRKYMHPDDGPRIAHEWEASVLAGRDVVDMEYRLREAASGKYRWFHARAVALKDASGRILQWLGSAMDIDDQRRAQSELSQLYEQARSVSFAFQQAALPSRLPNMPGLILDGFYQPSRHDIAVGGDWYDAFSLADGSLALTVGDVTGHGLDAAVIMAKIRYSIRALAMQAHETLNLPSLLRSVEEVLVTEHPDASATAFVAVIPADRLSLRYASAGHPPALLRTSGGKSSWLNAPGTPLGWSFETIREERSARIEDAFALVAYSDGLIEAGHDINAGMDRLQELVESGEAFDANSPAKALAESAALGMLHDDVAVLTVSFRR